ncbi:MAG: Gfo/Idh/MocA family oxidoreductase [Fimbriimonadaceae bacterium]|nr:Gfo/Idh/MocA family oxidoreductase [Fimbriimonadaceae bacterium]
MARRALLVGAGAMGRNWAQNLNAHPEVEIIGWCDIDLARAEQAIHELGLGALPGDNAAKMVAEMLPDFVVDVTVPEAHASVTIAALDAGIPVLGEKPMAESMESARKMVAASEAGEALYMVSQSRRYHPGLRAFRELVEGLGLGILNVDFYIGAHFGGFRDEMAYPLLLDMAIHTFDAARFVSGLDPVSVYAEAFNPEWSWYAGDACANAMFELTGGVRFNYRGSWCSEGVPTSWESEWRAVGTRGTAKWDGQHAPVGEWVQPGDGFIREVSLQTASVDDSIKQHIEGSLAEFLHALDTGATPNGECHDNIKSLAMVFAAVESAQTGQRIAISI